jgi:hypothetical protein
MAILRLARPSAPFRHHAGKNLIMLDLFLIAGALAFFGVSAAAVRGCAKL